MHSRYQVSLSRKIYSRHDARGCECRPTLSPSHILNIPMASAQFGSCMLCVIQLTIGMANLRRIKSCEDEIKRLGIKIDSVIMSGAFLQMTLFWPCVSSYVVRYFPARYGKTSLNWVIFFLTRHPRCID